MGILAMFGIAGSFGNRRRRRVEFRLRPIEILESRALLADGITVVPAPSLTAVVGIPMNNVVFATYTVTDPSGEPGTQFEGLINFGDGKADGPLIPVEKGSEFEFVDTHTYKLPGTYTVMILVAIPGTHEPNNNTVTTQVTVTSSAGTPTPTPTPTSPTSPPPPPVLRATGLNLKTREDKAFHGSVANFSEVHANAHNFSALIDWGDMTTPTSAQIRPRGDGRFAVIGSHRYVTPGIYHPTIVIRDALGQQIIVQGRVRVVK